MVGQSKRDPKSNQQCHSQTSKGHLATQGQKTNENKKKHNKNEQVLERVSLSRFWASMRCAFLLSSSVRCRCVFRLLVCPPAAFSHGRGDAFTYFTMDWARSGLSDRYNTSTKNAYRFLIIWSEFLRFHRPCRWLGNILQAAGAPAACKHLPNHRQGR